MIFMSAEPQSNLPATEPGQPPVPVSRSAAQGAGARLGAAGSARRAGRPWGRTLATGAVLVMAAFVTVQLGACGFKTPLQLPKKAPPPKPAS